MQVAFMQWSPKLMGQELGKSQVSLRGVNGRMFHVEITNEENSHYFLRYKDYCSF
jgi:hypothetical protein